MDCSGILSCEYLVDELKELQVEVVNEDLGNFIIEQQKRLQNSTYSQIKRNAQAFYRVLLLSFTNQKACRNYEASCSLKVGTYPQVN